MTESAARWSAGRRDASDLQPRENELHQPDKQDPVWAAFELTDQLAKRQAAEQPWYPFLTVSTMTVGVYELPEAGIDPQTPHERDELYYVVSGRAMLRVESDEVEVGPGSMVYVRAHAEHRFHDIEEKLQVIVFFSTAAPTAAPGGSDQSSRRGAG